MLASVGSFFMPVKRMVKEIGPNHCSKNCFLIQASEDDAEFDLDDGTNEFFTISNVKLTLLVVLWLQQSSSYETHQEFNFKLIPF